MAVKVRLQRVGKKNSPLFRIVAIERSNKRSGATLKILGFYNPKSKPPMVKIDQQALKAWVEKGAQLSETVRKISKL